MLYLVGCSVRRSGTRPVTPRCRCTPGNNRLARVPQRDRAFVKERIRCLVLSLDADTARSGRFARANRASGARLLLGAGFDDRSGRLPEGMPIDSGSVSRRPRPTMRGDARSGLAAARARGAAGPGPLSRDAAARSRGERVAAHQDNEFLVARNRQDARSPVRDPGASRDTTRARSIKGEFEETLQNNGDDCDVSRCLRSLLASWLRADEVSAPSSWALRRAAHRSVVVRTPKTPVTIRPAR